MLAAFAIVAPASDADASSTNSVQIDGYTINTEKSLSVKVDGNTATFTGSSTAGMISGSSSDFGTTFGDVASQYSAISVVLAKGNYKITQMNSALSLYPGDQYIKDGVKENTYLISAESDTYALLVPKDGSSVTLKIEVIAGDEVSKTTDMTFDFSKVSTKILLESKDISGTGWKYTTSDSTLAFTDYNGSEIFRATNDAGDLKVTFDGINAPKVYGVADDARAGGDAFVRAYHLKPLTVSAVDSDAKMNLTVSEGMFGFWGSVLTIGSAAGSDGKATITNISAEGGNRAFYSDGTGTITIQNSVIVASGSETAIRPQGSLTVIASEVTAKISGTEEVNEADGDGPIYGIKTKGIASIDEKSTVTTQGLLIEQNKTNNAEIKDIKGKLIVTGDYVQNPESKVVPAIAGLYTAVSTDLSASRVASASAASAGVISVVGDCDVYGMAVKTGDKTTEKTVSDESEVDFTGDIKKITLSLGAAATSADIEVPADKELLIVTNDSEFSGKITTGSGNGAQTIDLSGVKGQFSIEKGSVIVKDGTISAGTITVAEGDVLVLDDVVIAGNVTIDGEGTVMVKAGQKVTINDGFTLTVGAYMEVYGSVEKASASGTGKLKIDGQVKLMSGGSIAPAIIGCDLTYDESLMSEMTVSGVTDKGNTVFSSKNIVTVNGSWTLVAGSDVTVKGKLVVPEGAALRIEAGASLKIDNSAVLQIDGSFEIDEADTTAGARAGTLTVTKGEAVINGSVSISGAITATDKVTVAQDGVLTIASTGTMSGNGFSVDASGTLEIKGVYTGEVSVRNAGTVAIDSSVPATSKLTIRNVLDGAVVDVKKYTMTASVTDGGIDVTDADLVLTTFRDTAAKADVDVVLSGQSNVITVIPGFSIASDASNVDASVSGITIVSGVSSKKINGVVDDNVAAGIYKNKQYSKTMDVSGSIAAAYSVKEGKTLSATTGVNATAAVGMTAAGANVGIAVSGELSLGDNVTLTNSAGTLAVTGTVKAGEKAAFTNGAKVKITKDGEVSLVTKTLAGTVTATKYVTSEKNSSGTTVYTNHYVDINKALAAASAEGSEIKALSMLADQTVNADAVVKDGVTLDIGAKNLTIDKADAEITLTVAKGATVKGSGSIIVKDTLYAEDKTNMKVTDVKSDVKTEEVDESGKAVKNGWAKWTNLTVALDDAAAGAVITVTGESVVIESNTTVKDGVTLVIPATSYMVLNSGVTLTVDGILRTDGQIYAKGAFDLTAQKVANTASGSTSNAKYSSTVIVNGKLMSGTETVYGSGTTSTADGSDIADYKALFKPGAGAPIAGAYYTEGAYYVIAGLETALKDVSAIESDILIHGKVSVGDISVKGTENLTRIVVKADAATSASITANSGLIGTALTVKSIALDGATLVIEKDSNSGYFTGSAVIGDAAIAAAHATGFEFFAKDSKALLKGTVDISSDKTDAFGIAAGTVYTDEGFAVTVKVDSGKNLNAMTVAAGAAFVAEKASGTIAALVVDGALSVPADKQMTVTELTVNGTVEVDAATSTSASGTLNVVNLYIGMTEKDTTGAVAVFNGPVGFTDSDAKVLISSDAAVDDAFAASLADLKSTKVHVNGAVWFTAYGKGSAKFELKTVPVENVKLGGWAATEGGAVIKDGSNARLVFDFNTNYNENLYALIDTQVYRIIIKADEGIDNVYLNGQAMYYGLIAVGDNYYYGYTANVAAGSYNVTYTLKNGYSGEAKLTGDSVSGTSFSVSGDYAGDKVYQLSGIEKSGYVDPTPVTPSEKDDGMTITDYLLIVLVVLIVIMAVIVAMRLMRS